MAGKCLFHEVNLQFILFISQNSTEKGLKILTMKKYIQYITTI